MIFAAPHAKLVAAHVSRTFDPRSWRDEAACAGTYLSAVGEIATARNGEEYFQPDTATLLKLCASCPVRSACLLEALKLEEAEPGSVYGVWGGIPFGDVPRKASQDKGPVPLAEIPRLRAWAQSRKAQR